jgi:FkbM family methyltransferase
MRHDDAGYGDLGKLTLSARDSAKRLLRSATHAVGLDVTRYRPSPTGANALEDIRALLANVRSPTVFDVGANVGQSVTAFRELFPGSILHSFEPGPGAFRQLKANTRGVDNVHLVNAGVGSASGTQVLSENEHSDMSSFLRPAKAAWGSIVSETQIAVTTLDEYCGANHVNHIDLLKIDTQGYEFEVLQGATRLMAANQIRLIYMEVIFSEMYENLPSFDVMYRFLLDHNFRLVALYNFFMESNRVASWCDALFASEHSAQRDGDR